MGKVQHVGNQRQRVHVTGLQQGNGVFKGVRVDEGALDVELLLVNLVGVDLELWVWVSNPKHQNLAATPRCFNGLFLGLWQADRFDNDVIGIRLDSIWFLNIIDRLKAKVLPVVLQFFINGPGQGDFLDTPGLQDLGNQLTFKTITDNQRCLVRVRFQQDNPVGSTGNWFDYGRCFKRNVVWNMVNYFFRSREVFRKAPHPG